MEPAFLTADEIAKRLGIETYTFRSLVAKGDLPQGVEITGKKLKMWPAEDVNGIQWMIKNRTRMRKSTADEEEAEAE